MGFPGSSASKESACNAEDQGLIPRSERSPGEGNGNPLQCSCPENPRDGEPPGLLSMGLHRVGHDRSDLAAAAAVVSKQGFPDSSVGWETPVRLSVRIRENLLSGHPLR